MSTYTIDGRVVDDVTITKPQGTWKVSAAEIKDRELDGVGLLSYPGSLNNATVMAATYDNAQQRMIDVRTLGVKLDHAGREQYARFRTPLPVAPNSTVKLFVWDSLASGKPQQPVLTLGEGLAGEGSAESPYLIDSVDDLAKIDNEPAGHYRLTADLKLTGVKRAQIGRLAAFTGVFDGDGHVISGLSALADQGPGLFADNNGTIQNLVVQGEVTTDRTTAGLVADQNHGTIQRVRADGSLTANSYVGGITGHQFGTVRDSISTANVRATTQYVGGVVGVSVGGSVTENVLATGAVIANTASAGGVAAYGYTDTQVRHTVALNSTIAASSYAHAIVGRVYGGQVATLEDNHVARWVPISGQTLTEPPAADNQKGNVVAPEEIRRQAFYEARGWDFTTVWQWNDVAKRPTLRMAPEALDPAPVLDLPTDGRGFHIVDSVEDLTLIGEHPSYDYVLAADLDLTGVGRITPVFTGELDGAGHTLTGYASADGGLFASVTGRVHDLTLADASVRTSAASVGLLADRLDGTVERVATTGAIVGDNTVGGIVGYSCGVLRDAWSAAGEAVPAAASGEAVPAAAVLSVAGTGGIRHEAVANGDGTVTLAVSAGSVAADRQLSVLLLRGRASASAPDEDDIAYLGEVRLDGQGNATLTVLVPEPGKTALALNTSGDTARYTASLLPQEPPAGTPAMTVLDDTVTATVKPHGNAPAQVTITLVCAGKETCQEQVVVSHLGAKLVAQKVALAPGKTQDLGVNLVGEARATLLAGRPTVLDVQIGATPVVRVTVTPGKR
jgi:hypothetical protein